MKRTLLLVMAVAVMLVANGNNKESVMPVVASEEKPVAANTTNTTAQQKPENKDVVSYLLSDSTLQHRVIAIPQFKGRDLSYITVKDPNAPKKDSVTTVAGAKAKRDSLIATAKPEVIVPYPNKKFNRVISYGAGRNRNGRYSKECAAHANYRLQKFGIFSYGHAYQIPSHFTPVINGYSHIKLPKPGSITFQSIMGAHRQAADYVKAHLDISKLNPAKYYVVNMYYSTSPHMVEFFLAARKQQTGVYATHVGVLYYDKKAQAWIVEHNIHGNVYRDALVSVLGGKNNPHKYGITVIARASK